METFYSLGEMKESSVWPCVCVCVHVCGCGPSILRLTNTTL